MFKKLKDKIAEEVKFSPQRIQQLTQSVTDKLQNNSNEENFFSITEDDLVASPTSGDPGFTDVSLQSPSTMEPRSRRYSNSSMASDISFLPRYEPPSSLYHMQSDLDVSASEFEDNVSTSSQLGHISKEQVYAAFQKAQMRYHKYRGRYTDLANHYKVLEKENAKIKSVLVETQDKAIRRANELREQCSLEQKAKAHLENALRVELDERQMKIDTLQTKIKFLQTENIVDINETENLEALTKQLADTRSEIEHLNGKMQELKANSIVFNTKESEYKYKIGELDKILQEKIGENLQFSEREKENNLKLAQSKMELHAEINNKDVEISNLKREAEKYRLELEKTEKTKNGNLKLENLQTQNAKLIEKIEMLTTKCSNYENELVKLEQYKIEISNLKTEKDEVTTVYNLKLDGLEAALDESRSLCGALEVKCGNLDELREENERLNELMKNSEEIMKEKDDLFTNCSLLRSANEGLSQRIADLTNNNEEITKENEELLIEKAELESKCANLYMLRSECDILNRKIEDTTKNNEQVTKENEDLAKQIEKMRDLSRTIEELSMDKEDLAKQFEETVSNLKKSEVKISELQESISVNERNYNEELEKVRNDARNSLLTLENKIKETVEAEYKEKEAALKQEFDKRFETISSNETKDTEMKLMQTEDTLKVLQEENHQWRTATEQLNAKYYELESNHLELINENSQTGGEIAKLEKENEKNIKSVEALQKKLKKLHDKLDEETSNGEATKKLLEEKTFELQDLRMKTNELSEVIAEKQRQLDLSEVMMNELSLLQEVSTEQQNKNCALLDENKKLKAVVNDYDNRSVIMLESIAALKVSISAKEVEYMKLIETRRYFKEKSTELTAKLASCEEENLKLKKDIDNILLKKEEVCMKLEHIRKVHDANEDKYLNLQQRFIEKEGIILRLEEAMKLHQDEYKKQEDLLSREIENLREELTSIKQHKSELEMFVSNAETNENQIQEVRFEHERLQKLLQDKDRSIEDLKQEKVDKERTIADLKTQLETLRGVNGELETRKTQKGNLEKLLDSSEKQKKELSADNKKLKQELLDLKVINEKLKSTDKENSKLIDDISKMQTQIREFLHENQTLREQKYRFQTMERQHNEIQSELLEVNNVNAQFHKANQELQQRNQQLCLDYNQILHENEKHLSDFAEYKLAYDEIDDQMRDFENVKLRYEETIASLNESLHQTTKELSRMKSQKELLEQSKNTFVETTENQTSSLVNKIKQLETEKSDYDNLSKEHKSMKSEINNLTQMYEKTYKEKKDFESQLHELEKHYNEITHEKQLLLDEIQELKISPMNLTSNNVENVSNKNLEVDGLREKLEQYKSIDKANRASIEFFESELQKMKVKNEKLGRKLDETLVTLPMLTGHADFSDSTAILQYLRNVIFNYMTGKEGLVLAKVIAAVCKFDKDQTELVLQKEQQKQTLIGQLFGS